MPAVRVFSRPGSRLSAQLSRNRKLPDFVARDDLAPLVPHHHVALAIVPGVHPGTLRVDLPAVGDPEVADVKGIFDLAPDALAADRVLLRADPRARARPSPQCLPR